MANRHVSVRIDDEVQAAIALVEMKAGVSASEAMRLLIRAGSERTRDLPEAYWLGVRQGMEEGRKRVIQVATSAVAAAVHSALANLNATEG